MFYLTGVYLYVCSQPMNNIPNAEPQKRTPSDTLEAVEIRINLLRDESRMVSIKIDALMDRRKDINTEIKRLKEGAKQIKDVIAND